MIKEDLKAMMKVNPDLPSKKARRNLIKQQIEKLEKGERTYNKSSIPELNKVN